MRQPLVIDGQDAGIARGVPALGQHNAELLGAGAASAGCGPLPVPSAASA